MLIKLLRGDNHLCDEAEDGNEAVKKYKQKYELNSEIDTVVYDAILMDFMMPICDGPTATKLIRDMGYKGLILGVTGRRYMSIIL
jgi:CheY-like chemotaxis protein